MSDVADHSVNSSIDWFAWQDEEKHMPKLSDVIKGKLKLEPT